MQENNRKLLVLPGRQHKTAALKPTNRHSASQRTQKASVAGLRLSLATTARVSG
jgi:hypothetical protein